MCDEGNYWMSARCVCRVVVVPIFCCLCRSCLHDFCASIRCYLMLPVILMFCICFVWMYCVRYSCALCIMCIQPGVVLWCTFSHCSVVMLHKLNSSAVFCIVCTGFVREKPHRVLHCVNFEPCTVKSLCLCQNVKQKYYRLPVDANLCKWIAGSGYTSQ